MYRNGFLLGLLLLLSSNIAHPQSGSISGIVTDSISGHPVANLSVFIPFTTIGTTTNVKGGYVLDRLPPGDYTLMFRHISYQSYSVPMTIASGEQRVLNLAVASNSYDINEVVKTGGKADPHAGYQLFKEFFLGDPNEVSCVIQNPEVLRYYTDGDETTAYAREPLIIMNRHLGYRITYFLDYFRFVANQNSHITTAVGPFYAFAGSAVYEDLSDEMPMWAGSWKSARENEFYGSLKHFLACLYSDGLGINGYRVRKVYDGFEDVQKTEKIGLAMSKVRYAMMDSVFFWNPDAGGIEFLHYLPDDDYTIGRDKVKESSEPGIKKLTTDPHILIFKDSEKTGDLKDDWIFSMQLPDSVITFDHEGNYTVPTGEFGKTNLNNTVRIRVLLPLDYLPAPRKQK